MTLYVVNVANPPPGTDWQTMVPGAYLYDVTGITATLATPGGVGPMLDSSGNARDGTYPNAGTGNFVPGLVAGDLALLTDSGFDVFGFYPGQIITSNTNFTIEAVVKPVGAGGIQVWGIGSADANTQIQLIIQPNGQIVMLVGGTLAFGIFASFPGKFPYDGNPHHVAGTYNAVTGNPHLYIDGVDYAASPNSVAGPPTGPITQTCVGAAPGVFPAPPGAGTATIDEAAIYGTVLTPARVAAHNAARGAGFAAYSAAVLADVPAAYYHLDNVSGSTGRTPGLAVTDGTTEVVRIGDGFPAVTTPGPYRYSWQPRIAADTQTGGGTLTTVAVPALVLPAGYTIGTRTPDMQPGDQWSDIAVWWNDNIQQARDPAQRPKYPPGAYLVYQQRGT